MSRPSSHSINASKCSKPNVCKASSCEKGLQSFTQDVINELIQDFSQYTTETTYLQHINEIQNQTQFVPEGEQTVNVNDNCSNPACLSSYLNNNKTSLVPQTKTKAHDPKTLTISQDNFKSFPNLWIPPRRIPIKCRSYLSDSDESLANAEDANANSAEIKKSIQKDIEQKEVQLKESSDYIAHFFPCLESLQCTDSKCSPCIYQSDKVKLGNYIKEYIQFTHGSLEETTLEVKIDPEEKKIGLDQKAESKKIENSEEIYDKEPVNGPEEPVNAPEEPDNALEEPVNAPEEPVDTTPEELVATPSEEPVETPAEIQIETSSVKSLVEEPKVNEMTENINKMENLDSRGCKCETFRKYFADKMRGVPHTTIEGTPVPHTTVKRTPVAHTTVEGTPVPHTTEEGTPVFKISISDQHTDTTKIDTCDNKEKCQKNNCNQDVKESENVGTIEKDMSSSRNCLVKEKCILNKCGQSPIDTESADNNEKNEIIEESTESAS